MACTLLRKSTKCSFAQSRFSFTLKRYIMIQKSSESLHLIRQYCQAILIGLFPIIVPDDDEHCVDDKNLKIRIVTIVKGGITDKNRDNNERGD